MIDSRLLDAAKAIGIRQVTIGYENYAGYIDPRTRSRAEGFYNVINDSIVLKFDPKKYNHNMVLAHEIIHATGFFQRLDRAIIGRMSRNAFGLVECPNFGSIYDNQGNWLDLRHILPSRDESLCEEIIAQYGAMLLLDALSIPEPNANQWVKDYLVNCGRASGMPNESEIKEAIQAIVYVLTSMRKADRIAA